MRTFKVSDQMYEQLKSFIVNPFDDTPEVVLSRLIAIANKARDHWSPFEPAESAPPVAAVVTPSAEPSAKPRRKEQEAHAEEEEPVVVL